METPQTQYARADDGTNIAYQVFGDGPISVVAVPGWISHVDLIWTDPGLRAFYERLAGFSRVVAFDKRGTGASDRVDLDNLPSLERRMDDVRTVMDAAGVGRAALFGVSEGGPMSILFGATHPDRVRALVLYGSFATLHDEHSILQTAGGDVDLFEHLLVGHWNEGWPGLEYWAPTIVGRRGAQEHWAMSCRLCASPRAASALFRMALDTDVREAATSLHVPTLAVHRIGDRVVGVEHARELARLTPDADLVELPGNDHFHWVGDSQAILDQIENFLTGTRHEAEPNRVLATVLFTDIVGSTERAAELGDSSFRRLLDEHDALAEREIDRFRGRLVKRIGDGLLATFDGPARGVRCARSLTEAVRTLGIDIRAGLHTGEIELRGDDDVGGLAVHIGARVSALARPAEVLVSRTVRDLTAGSGLSFEDRGTHRLKGVPDEWQLFAATS